MDDYLTKAMKQKGAKYFSLHLKGNIDLPA